MTMWVFDYTTISLIFLPLHLLCLTSFLLLQFHRRLILLGNSGCLSGDHLVVYSLRHMAVLLLPFFVEFYLLCGSLRGADTTFCLAQLHVDSWVLKYFFLCGHLVAFFFTLFSFSMTRTTLPYLAEVCAAAIWLFWCFFWLFLVSNITIFIFFLELLGLLLLIVLLYLFIILDRQLNSVGLNHKLFNTAYGSKFLFIQTLLFFLWSSALSMLLLFWGCLTLGVSCLSLDLLLVELFYTFASLAGDAVAGAAHFSLLFLFFFAVLLKGAIVPLQLWLVIFYKHLPLMALFSYLIFYYIYFIVVIFNFLFGYLYIFSQVWFAAAIMLFLVACAHSLLNLSEVFTFRSFLAYSSIINLFLLFAFALSGVGFSV